jgi:hypothetical protein
MKARPVFVSTHASGFLVGISRNLNDSRRLLNAGTAPTAQLWSSEEALGLLFPFYPVFRLPSWTGDFSGPGVVGFGWTAGLA